MTPVQPLEGGVGGRAVEERSHQVLFSDRGACMSAGLLEEAEGGVPPPPDASGYAVEMSPLKTSVVPSTPLSSQWWYASGAVCCFVCFCAVYS